MQARTGSQPRFLRKDKRGLFQRTEGRVTMLYSGVDYTRTIKSCLKDRAEVELHTGV